MTTGARHTTEATIVALRLKMKLVISGEGWWEVRLFVALTAFKMLLLPMYRYSSRSTDFEVHRNWLAITHSLPIHLWYTEQTSEWTLDYPPFFAWFEWLISQIAQFVDMEMLRVDNLNHASSSTVVFQCMSIALTDIVLFGAVSRFCKEILPEQARFKVIVLVCANAGLVIVDHIHFQYNGMLLGMLILSLSLISEGNDLAGAIVFAVLLNFKHIFAYLAPVYVVYLFRHYCFVETRIDQRESKTVNQFKLSKFLVLSSCVLLVFALSFGPFLYYGQMSQVLKRLFPVKRGLSHAYWAPNVWALYNLLDKLIVVVLKFISGGVSPLENDSMTRGLVGDVMHAVLPSITINCTVVITLIVMMPVLMRLWSNTGPKLFIPAVLYCTMCSFMFGFHVHEKAILMVTIPMGLLSCNSGRDAGAYIFLSTVSNFSLLPLIFTPREYILKITLVASYTALSVFLLHESTVERTAKMRIRPSLFLSRWHIAYLIGLIVVEFAALILPLILPRFEFLPLLLYSAYCLLGMSYSMTRLYALFMLRTENS